MAITEGNDKIQLVLLPGLMCDATVWLDQIRALEAQADCQVADYGLADSIQSMAGGVLSWAPPRFAIAGHSMGGRVAFEILRLAPERVTHLALMDTRMHPIPAGEAGEKETAGRYALLEIAEKQGVRAMGEKWVQGMVHPDRLNDTALITSILDMFERKTADIFARQQNALIHRPDAAPVARAIRLPTLVLCGRQDSWSQPEWHEEMARVIPGSRLEVIENAGHMATMEQPGPVSRAMSTWLAR
jgi:pimeloyl-ACP methyl ester carboxylesterase